MSFCARRLDERNRAARVTGLYLRLIPHPTYETKIGDFVRVVDLINHTRFFK